MSMHAPVHAGGQVCVCMCLCVFVSVCGLLNHHIADTCLIDNEHFH